MEEVYTLKGRVSTGFAFIDDLIGGCRYGSMVLVSGPPHHGKSLFLQQFASTALREGYPVLYICYDTPPDVVKESLIRIGLEPRICDEDEKLIIVDAFSARGQVKSNKKWAIENPKNAIELSLTISKCIELLQSSYPGKPIITICDSLSTLAITVGFEPFKNLSQSLATRAVAWRVVFMGAWLEGAHAPHEDAVVESLANVVIRLESDERTSKKTMKIIAIETLSKMEEASVEYEIHPEPPFIRIAGKVQRSSLEGHRPFLLTPSLTSRLLRAGLSEEIEGLIQYAEQLRYLQDHPGPSMLLKFVIDDEKEHTGIFVDLINKVLGVTLELRPAEQRKMMIDVESIVALAPPTRPTPSRDELVNMFEQDRDLI